jgi:hypothetical protein
LCIDQDAARMLEHLEHQRHTDATPETPVEHQDGAVSGSGAAASNLTTELAAAAAALRQQLQSLLNNNSRRRSASAGRGHSQQSAKCGAVIYGAAGGSGRDVHQAVVVVKEEESASEPLGLRRQQQQQQQLQQQLPSWPPAAPVGMPSPGMASLAAHARELLREIEEAAAAASPLQAQQSSCRDAAAAAADAAPAASQLPSSRRRLSLGRCEQQPPVPDGISAASGCSSVSRQQLHHSLACSIALELLALTSAAQLTAESNNTAQYREQQQQQRCHMLEETQETRCSHPAGVDTGTADAAAGPTLLAAVSRLCAGALQARLETEQHQQDAAAAAAQLQVCLSACTQRQCWGGGTCCQARMAPQCRAVLHAPQHMLSSTHGSTMQSCAACTTTHVVKHAWQHNVELCCTEHNTG